MERTIMPVMPQSKPKRDVTRARAPRRPCRILVVEDDADMRQWVAEVLAEAGFEAVTAPDVLTATMSLLADRIDAVVTDWKMPGLDGLDLLDSVGRLAPGTPVVLVTAYLEPHLHERVITGGAFSLLAKPFRREELLVHLRKALRHHAGGSSSD